MAKLIHGASIFELLQIEKMAEVHGKSSDMDGSSTDDYDDNLHIEPAFEAFICPLTKKLMQDPVVLENGHTFEHDAIQKWLNKCTQSGKQSICPLSLQELTSTNLVPNIALRNTIEEWTQRNDAAKLNCARLTLSPGSSESTILKALSYIQKICNTNRINKNFIRTAKVIPRIIECLRSNSRSVQCKALETLCVVTEDDLENKEAVVEGNSIRTIVKFLVHGSPNERLEAVSLLYELSNSESLSERIGEVHGAILILIGIASNKIEDASVVQKAEKILENLEMCEKNVLQMAENGRVQPLLRHLIEGSPKTQLAMASYLGELVLTNDLKVLVANKVGAFLVNLMVNGSKEENAIALKALNQISSYEKSAKLLTEVGVLPPLVANLLNLDNNDLPITLREMSADILRNIIASCPDSASIAIVNGNQTLVSEDIIHNILHLISNTGPAFQRKIIIILVALSSTPTNAKNVLAAIRSSGAVTNLIPFIEASQEDTRVASMKLLHNIAPYMSLDLTSYVCDSAGHLTKLFGTMPDNNVISEEQAAAIGVLAEMPDNDLKLIRRLHREQAFDIVIDQINRIRRGEIRGGHHVNSYLTGLVKVLSKLIYNLENLSAALAFVHENNIPTLFSDLLLTNGNESVQIISALAMESLSKKSKNFVRKYDSSFCTLLWSKKKPITTTFCKVHRRSCSMEENFCLVEGNAVDKLISCLDHANKELVEASLAAICTLLDDGLDLQNAIFKLLDVDGIKPIMQLLLKDDNTETLQQKVVWAVERLLRNDDVVRDVSTYQGISGALLIIFQHGDSKTKPLASKALKHIGRLPTFSEIGPKIK